MAKKSNHISYELANLEKYIGQLQSYLDNHPVDEIEDRIENTLSATGAAGIKVIATKEQQLKAYMDTLAKIPKLLEDLNSLRRSVEDEDEKQQIRGDASLPGFMIGSGYLKENENIDNEDFPDEYTDDDPFDDE